MSAFIIDDAVYIKILATLLQSEDWEYMPTNGLNRISFVKGLRSWNYKSVNHRYREDTKEDPLPFPDLETLRMMEPFTDVQLYKMLACVNYQSCEVSEWTNSPEEVLLIRIQENLASTFIQKAAEYKAAKWGDL